LAAPIFHRSDCRSNHEDLEIIVNLIDAWMVLLIFE
jgi:hypothetical protein